MWKGVSVHRELHVHLAIDSVGQKQAGVATVLLDTISAALRNPHVSTLTVLCSPRSARSFDLLPSPRLVEVEETIAENFLLRLWWHERGLSRRVHEVGADVVLCAHSAGLTGGDIPHATFVQRPIVYSPESRRQVPAKHRYRMPLIRYSMGRSCRSARRIFVQTPVMAEEVVAHFGVSSDLIDIIPPQPRALPVSSHIPPILDRMTHPHQGLRILFVGELFPHKNVGVAIAAVGRLQARFPGARMFVSAPPNRPLADAPHVVKLGFVSDEALRQAFELADVFVMPSLHETVGLPMLEAMSVGTPVLAADRRYAHDVCEDAALYFDPLDPADLARAVSQLATDPQLRATLVQRGHTLVEKRAAGRPYDRMIERTLEIRQ